MSTVNLCLFLFTLADEHEQQLELLIDLSSFFISYIVILYSTLTHIGVEM